MSNFLKDLFSGKTSLNINGKSKHLNTDIEFNEDNPGLGLTIENGNKLLALGGYKNSFSEPSYYIGAGLKKRFGNDLYIEPGLLGGVVTGYDKKLTPMVLPSLSFGIKDYGALNLMYAPEYHDNPATVMMNLSVPFE